MTDWMIHAEDEAERKTQSGILLAEPDPDKGVPFVGVITDVTGLQFNVAGDTIEAVNGVAASVAERQNAIARGETVDPLPFFDAIYGNVAYMMPTAIARVALVTRSYAQKIDMDARRKQAELQARLVRGVAGGPPVDLFGRNGRHAES